MTTVAEAVASLECANAELRRAAWQLRQLKRAVRLARSNNAELRQVLDDLERCFPPERPALQVVKGGDDA